VVDRFVAFVGRHPWQAAIWVAGLGVLVGDALSLDPVATVIVAILLGGIVGLCISRGPGRAWFDRRARTSAETSGATDFAPYWILLLVSDHPWGYAAALAAVVALVFFFTMDSLLTAGAVFLIVTGLVGWSASRGLGRRRLDARLRRFENNE
jgi:hypothetical protein